MAWEIIADYSTMYPPYYMLERAYEDYRLDARPAGPYPKNQCAIRMSVALGRCGFSLSAFPHPHRVVTHPYLPVPYVMGARELADYLTSLWGRPRVFQQNLGSLPEKLSTNKGVLYFNNCFHRGGDDAGTRKGDHIDLWNGKKYYNQLFHIPAGQEDHRSSSPLFGRSDQVWFFEMA